MNEGVRHEGREGRKRQVYSTEFTFIKGRDIPSQFPCDSETRAAIFPESVFAYSFMAGMTSRIAELMHLHLSFLESGQFPALAITIEKKTEHLYIYCMHVTLSLAHIDCIVQANKEDTETSSASESTLVLRPEV